MPTPKISRFRQVDHCGKGNALITFPNRAVFRHPRPSIFGPVNQVHLDPAGEGEPPLSPAILGTWTGAYAYSDLAAAVFLAIGAGAIAQVVYAVTRYTLKLTGTDGLPAFSPVTVGGFAAGVAIMYATALLIAA